MDWHEYNKEVEDMSAALKRNDDNEHIYSRHERIASYIIRLNTIKNEIYALELDHVAPPELKKFRTTILADTIEAFKVAASYESRKLEGIKIEMELSR